MFGNNEIIGKSYFNDAGEKLFVTSIFQTLQGEGPLRGEPAIFVRLTKCNLACSFCDTFFDHGDWFTIDELENAIENTINNFYKDKNLKRPEWTKHSATKRKKQALILTGGEPMLQKNIVPFLEHMNNVFEKTQIESNGIVPQNIPNETILVISPKCIEKNGVAIKYIKPHKKNLERADCLKFVMSADQNSPYKEIPNWAFEWKEETGRDIFISPMNMYNSEPQKSKQLRMSNEQITLDKRSTEDEIISFWEEGLLDMEANQKNHEYAAKYCVEHGLILNLQIHLYASLA